ncbi:MAG TPA: 50S ribosomal protein L7/L12 [Candidatus Wildermuthbacteria bacterium]|nr:50S ribosomal protein L7/L12 [Candidatus Wildermuthbacteria bacterium]
MTEEIKDAPQEKKEEETKTKEVEVPAKFASLVESIEKLSVLDLAELVKILEEKFGVSSAAPVQVAAAAPGNGEEAADDAKSSYNIELTVVGEKKIEVIKAVRDATGKGLKEAKDLVDAAASSPQMVSENVKAEDAEELKKKFTEAGATVELK